MLQNAYFLAKSGFDTAENEPSKVCPIEPSRSIRLAKSREEVPAPRGDPAADRPGHRAPGPRPEPDSRLAGGVPVFDVCGRHRGKAASLAALLDRGLPPAPVLLPRRARHGHRCLAEKNLTLT